MKIFDISQEVFGCEVFPGDPAPQRETLCSMDAGSIYNLTALSMCTHNGTHIDAPRHFLQNGADIASIPLQKTVGLAYVANCEQDLTAADAEAVLQRARHASPESAHRILLSGPIAVNADAAEVFVKAGVDLIGVESQTVAPQAAPAEVHRILLGAEIVILEGIRLSGISEGVYELYAAPLALAGSDGAPCRAILIERETEKTNV